MKRYVKLFCNSDQEVVEENVNDWVKKNDVSIVDFKLAETSESERMGAYTSILVIYEKD